MTTYCPACKVAPATGRHHRGTVSLCGDCFATKTAAELDAATTTTTTGGTP